MGSAPLDHGHLLPRGNGRQDATRHRRPRGALHVDRPGHRGNHPRHARRGRPGRRRGDQAPPIHPRALGAQGRGGALLPLRPRGPRGRRRPGLTERLMDHGFSRGLTNYGDRDFALYLRRSFARSMGYTTASLAKPVVGIADSGSGFNNCHRHFPELIDAVKRGVLAAGGLPIDFPTISLGEVFLEPTSMLYRNLMSMDVEEMVRAQPMDAVVLVGGCDKTVPAQLMGAASAGVPAVQLVAGPMMTGRWEGERLGACTDCRRFWGRYRAGQISRDDIDGVESRLATTAGTCAVMGTASTMACIAETLGMTLPGTAAIPAVHADRLRAAEATGEAAVRMTTSRLTPDRILTPSAFENALRVLLAIGGSTNAIIHLTAIAGRAGVPISLTRLNAISDE